MTSFFDKYPQVKRWGYILAGLLLYALALDLFLIGNNIAAGGISGIAIVLHTFIPLEVSVMLLLMNIPILLAAFFVNGWKYTATAVIASFLYSGVVELGSSLPTITTNPLVAAVFGGVLYGAGMAFLAFGQGSTGGTDLIVRLLVKRFPKMSLGKMALFVEGGIVLFAIVAFKDIEVGLYAIITIAVCSMVADRMIMGLDKGCICMVVSAGDPKTIADCLMKRLGRAVTKVDGMGMYAESHRSILYIAVRPQETPLVKECLSEVDPRAFVVVIPANEVLGGTFRVKSSP